MNSTNDEIVAEHLFTILTDWRRTHPSRSVRRVMRMVHRHLVRGVCIERKLGWAGGMPPIVIYVVDAVIEIWERAYGRGPRQGTTKEMYQLAKIPLADADSWNQLNALIQQLTCAVVDFTPRQQ